MKYKITLDYTPTDPAGETSQRVCNPTNGDDLAVSIEMESDEWYRKRKLNGKLTFLREDYGWIMGRAFDGTFKMTVQSSTDGGATWQNYFEGTFSRANLTIDEDNKSCVLDGLNEGGEYNVVENGKSEEYDLMKIIPDADAKEVQGEVHPALALVDYNASSINHSDIFCDAAGTSSGYKADKNDWTEFNNVETNQSWNLIGIYAEAKVVMKDHSSEVEGIYKGVLSWYDYSEGGYYLKSIKGDLYNDNNCKLDFHIVLGVYNYISVVMELYNSNGQSPSGYGDARPVGDNTTGYYSPSSYEFISRTPDSRYEKVTIYFHYIRATLLTQTGGNADNVLDTGDYYKRMAAFNNGDGGLTIAITTNTVEQPNGHRLVPGTGEQGMVPQYFAPPDNTAPWIPLCEYEWQYGSLWYTIVPSVANGLLDPTKVGTFRWTRCWTLGTCLDRLLKKITNNKVTFDQSEAGSEFLYSAVNPLTQGEPFEYLFTQKSNVMRPSVGGESAARCIVRLEWFLEFLRNALNCYWWLEERNGGTYAFRVEHVEWFRRGGSYTGQMDAQFNLTVIKTRRNFVRNGDAAKRLDDQLHKYSYEMNGMTEKYLFAWQGDGGSDAFKGNPMWFKAGWVEKGTSESKEVDNIFADLSWLMLNAGSDTESAKNYEGLFAFGGYRRADVAGAWREEHAPIGPTLLLAEGHHIVADCFIWMTIPSALNVTLRKTDNGVVTDIATYQGTGEPQCIRVLVDELYIGGTHSLTLVFGAAFYAMKIHRIQARSGVIYTVPNVRNMLGSGFLQNGVLAWPWLQCEFLHYDVPAQRWGYKYDDLEALDSHEDGWETDGTVKLRKKQDVPLLPLPTRSDEEDLDKGVIGGLKDSQGRLQTGIVKSATINLGTRDAELTLMYDMIS